MRHLPLCVILALGGYCGLSAASVPRLEYGNLILEGVPAIPPALTERLLQYQNTRSAVLCGWLPRDDGLIITTRFASTPQFHVVRQAGGARSQLTFFPEPVGQGAVHPARDELLFTMSRGGDEFDQLHRLNLTTGRTETLTAGRFIHRAPLWNHRGSAFAFLSNRRNGTDWDVYLAEADHPTTGRLVAGNGGFWSPTLFSPDDTRLLVTRSVSANEGYVFVLDLTSGALTPVNSAAKKVAFAGVEWTADGQGLWLVSDEDGEHQRLYRQNLASGRKELITPNLSWDIEMITSSRDGRHLAFTVNADGLSQLFLLDPATLRYHEIAGLPAGVITGLEFDHGARRLALTLGSAQSPSDVYVLDLATEKATRWTTSEIGGLDAASFVSPELVRWPTFDETAPGEPRTLTGFLYRPAAPGPAPVLIDIHGGPEAQARPGFSSWTQFLVRELGIAVLQPNVRGSTGYGKTFLRLDDGPRREDAVRDIGALLDWIVRQPGLDASRVAVCGGSYGGYMVNSSLTHYNNRLRGGICVVGISNFVTFLKKTESYRRDLRRAEYGDERDPATRAFLEAISPLHTVSNISRPMLFVHGLNDPRVPVSETEQMARAVRANGAEAWLVLAKNEGHGFQKKSNRDYQQTVTALFLQHIFGLPAFAAP